MAIIANKDKKNDIFFLWGLEFSYFVDLNIFWKFDRLFEFLRSHIELIQVVIFFEGAK